MLFINLTNTQFGRLTVIRLNGRNKHGHFMWQCKCSCEKETIASTSSLRSKKIVSCGCYKSELTSKRNTKHSASKSLAYVSWKAMKTRCYNTKVRAYVNYGGRGISVCERWLASFQNFLCDMGERPSLNHSIERKNNAGNYEPGNCCWATKKEQNRNTRQNHLVLTDLGLMTVSQAVELSGRSLSTIKQRIKNNTLPSDLLK